MLLLCLQVVIFVKSVLRAKELNKLLVECNFPSICIHSAQKQEERYALNTLQWRPASCVLCFVRGGTLTTTVLDLCDMSSRTLR